MFRRYIIRRRAQYPFFASGLRTRKLSGPRTDLAEDSSPPQRNTTWHVSGLAAAPLRPPLMLRPTPEVRAISPVPLAERCRRGEALDDLFVVDAHCHMGPWQAFYVPEGGTAASMVHAMDRLGIDVAVASPHLGIGPDYREGNRQVMAAAAEFPGRILPYVTINANYPYAEIEAEIKHWHERRAIRAFKLHPALHNRKATDDHYAPLFEYAHAHRLPVLSHSWAGDALGGPAILAELAARYPRANILIGHSASSWQMVEEASAAALAHPNLYLDLTGSILTYGMLEDIVGRVGARRVLLGTDMPFIDARPGLGRVLMSRLSEGDKRLILGENARGLFGL